VKPNTAFSVRIKQKQKQKQNEVKKYEQFRGLLKGSIVILLMYYAGMIHELMIFLFLRFFLLTTIGYVSYQLFLVHHYNDFKKKVNKLLLYYFMSCWVHQTNYFY